MASRSPGRSPLPLILSLETALALLRLGKVVSPALPVPLLSIVFDTAVSIGERALKIKNTRDACRSLSERATRFTAEVYEHLRNSGDSGSTATSRQIEVLLGILQDIDGLMRRRRRTRLVRLVFRADDIADEVKELNRQLDDTIMSFMVQNALDNNHRMGLLVNTGDRILQHIDDSTRVHVRILERTRSMSANVATLLRRVELTSTHDGTMRFFGREDVMLTGVVDDHTAPRPRELGQSVVRHRATLRTAPLSGVSVVVYTYPKRDSRFVAAVDLAKKIWHPNITSILGYSRPGDAHHSFIVTEEYHPSERFICSVGGVNSVRLTLQMVVKELCIAIDHLEGLGLGAHVPQIDTCIDGDESVYVVDFSSLALQATSYDPCDIARLWFGLLSRSTNSTIVQLPRTCRTFWAAVPPHEIPQIGSWVRPRYISVPYENTAQSRSAYDGVPSRSRAPDSIEHFFSCRPYALVLPPDSQADQNEDPDDYYLRNRYRGRHALGADWDHPENATAMCADFELQVGFKRTRWKRYQIREIPPNMTLLFSQTVCLPDIGDVVQNTVLAFNVVEEGQDLGLVSRIDYFTETSVIGLPSDHEPLPTPLYFFTFQHGTSGQMYHNSTIPWGFWSTEKDPLSLPTGITFDPGPHFERINDDLYARIYQWTQVLDGRMFSIQTKINWLCEVLRDNILALLRELRDDITILDINEYNEWHKDVSDKIDEPKHGENECDTDEYHTAEESLGSMSEDDIVADIYYDACADDESLAGKDECRDSPSI
ncbi:hypothetical protein C8Q79DRAFT_1009694 [Trametes meyenii]|nr:hypothetical protein C8Q79DRAFT_1009694 [Trametes meyenii]